MSDRKDLFGAGFPGGSDEEDPFAAPDPHPAKTTPDVTQEREDEGGDEQPSAQEIGEAAPDVSHDKDAGGTVEPPSKKTVTPKSPPAPVEKAPKQPEPGEEHDADDGDEDLDDPLSNAVQEAQNKSLMAQLPIFDNGVREEIENPDQTFEELRQAKAPHFSELQDAARVSWTMAYGVVKKPIYKPKEQKIGDVKREIERSKEFVKGLAKDRHPECFVRPTVTAQKKGVLPSYMAVCTSLEEARTSGKVITLFPGADGRVHERRDLEIGEFITPSGYQEELSRVESGFRPALPPIPASTLESIIAFFRAVMYRDKACTEALVNIYWDRKEKQFCVDVPPQKVSHEEVETDLNGAPDPERYLHYMDIHSHNTMRAQFSRQDDADERATRLYAVVGRLDRYFPELTVRISNNGHFHEIDPHLVFEPGDSAAYRSEWMNKVVLLDAAKGAA